MKGGSQFIVSPENNIKWCSLDNAYIRYNYITNPFLKNGEISHDFFSSKFNISLIIILYINKLY